MGRKLLPVSPTSPKFLVPDSFGARSLYLSNNSNFSFMTKNELLLSHVLLHKFYATGNKKLSKNDLKVLHKQLLPHLEKHMKHIRFDELDD